MTDEHDKLLPIANVGRIMKQILPPHAKISKEAKERMQECASEFISFVTSEASDRCRKGNRKTVNGDDICSALSSLGLDNYSEAMLRYLQKLRQSERQRANQSNQVCISEDKDEASTTNSVPSFDFGILDRGGSTSSDRHS
ncbi:Class 2 transcription repressor NC2, beta subunit (Dr1) [Handroanthus impetiginosus]|uniref:Class 2 transcription repressor NC2, beta subunit (Dr1) n=1 Tax=Handroanthus impetiginosus TaxID=429701 RepID=A0A2G9I2F4_9LAMI|nr:Class 2 transcription repressor NC2, beta subunit (Dr1) [Handroanthus impetiginosus]